MQEEAGRRAVAVARSAHVAHAEPEPGLDEVEDRRPAEQANGIERPLVARHVDRELIARAETARVREQDASDGEGAEAELVRREDDASATDGPAAVQDAELAGNDQDVAGLALGQLREHLDRPSVLT